MILSSSSPALPLGLLVTLGLVACASNQAAPYGGSSSGSNSPATGAGGSSATTTTLGTATSSAGTTGTTTTGSATTTTGVAAATTAGGATGTTTTDATSTTGSEEEFTCANRPTVTVAKIADFEDYDGVTTDLTTYGFPVNDDGSGDTTNIRYAGLYDGSDMSGTPTLLMVAGNGSNYAVQAANDQATEWGGGIGFWMNCINATGFSGISMALRGTTPTGDITVTVQEEDASGTSVSYSTEVAITDTWTVQQFAFSSLTNDDAGTTATGDNIVGLNIGAVMTWVETSEGSGEWVPEPAGYELAVDDLTFY